MNFLLHRRITISMLFIALTLLGYVSYRQLSVELLPNAELPTLFVMVSSNQEYDPSYLESEIIIPLEGAISSEGGVEKISSSIDSRQSTIRVDFKAGGNFQITALKLEERINKLAATFPDGFRVQVQKVDMQQMANAFMVLQVRGSGGVDRVRNVVDKEISPELENIDGVASVNVYGGRERAIEVQLNPEMCKALNLTPSSISATLTQNTRDKEFAGFAIEPDGQFFVHVSSPYTHVSELENIVVAPGPVHLKDVATIFFDLKEETSYSRVNGKDAVSVSLSNDSKANLIELSHKVQEGIDRINEKIAHLDVEVVVQENSAQVMEDNINDIIDLAVTGGLLAIIILWFFLKNIRLVMLIGLSIPISIYTAFNFFYAAGITINSLTLIGMALAVGMLLDNSVVVLENIYRLSGNGMSPERSVTQGTTEVWRSIVAATLTTVTVFLPFIFSDNFLIKLIGNHIGVSIVSTLTVSLVVALVFIPMVTYVILRLKNRRAVFYEEVSVTQRPIQLYLVFLKAAMRNPGTTIIGSIVLFFVTLIGAITLNIQSMQDIESDRFNIYVTMPRGSTLEKSDQIVKLMEDRLEGMGEMDELICRIREQDAVLTLVLKEDFKKTGKRRIGEIKSEVLNKVKDIQGSEVSVYEDSGNQGGGAMSGLGGFMRLMGIGQQQERIVIKGSDYDMMFQVAEDLRYQLNEQDFVDRSWVSYTGRQAELLLNFDPILLTSYEISRGDISNGLMSLNPEFSSGTTFKVGEDTYDIIIRNDIPKEKTTLEITELAEEVVTDTLVAAVDTIPTVTDSLLAQADTTGISIDSLTALADTATAATDTVTPPEPIPTVLAEELEFNDKTIDDLKAVQIKSAKGGLHRLDEVAAINEARGRARIMRVNQDKQLELYYSFGRNAEASKQLLEGYRSDIDALVAAYNLPSGMAIEVIHEEDEFAEFKFLILAALILIFMILASVFESFTTPFVLLFSIPLAAIGSLLALLLTGNSLLNANTLMGFLILLGVVVNNGIILIDYANILRSRGYRRNRALMAAGLSRIRPILITSITTIVAMLPLALGDAEYSGAIGAPFAITVIGGLAFSTILTLVYIPTVCLGMENALAWYRSLSPRLWITHAILFIIGVAAIYFNAEGLLWQSICLVAIVILIPGITFFIQNSLRRASEGIVDPNEEIQITVRNLVKVYDRPGKIRRDLDSGEAVNKRLGTSKDYHSLRDFVNDVWLMIILAFTIYLAWFHIDSGIWIFLLSIAIYAMILLLWRKLRKYLFYRFEGSRTIRIINRIIFWSIPPLVWLMMLSRLDNAGLSVFIGILWAAGIAIYITSRRLYEKNINIERVTGRFAGLRRSYYRLVKSIPVIGKQKKPFKALRGVSFTIHKGMFGLLGPNGAGKSTMMRIICGILEQSYGSIYVNNLDAREFREELQGLIGFLPQEFGTYEHMTSTEFLDYQAILKGLTDTKVREERIEYVLKAVHMYERKDDKIGSFSGGMKQRIGIALILLHLPRILIVDEPTAGLDPRERIRFRNLLVELSKERIVIFSTHIIEDISSSCSQVVVINKGELKYFGDPVDMVNMANGKVWQFSIDRSAFETLDKSMVIHHMQNGDTIQVRYLSYEQPQPDAVLVEVNLEDAYLCLLKNMN